MHSRHVVGVTRHECDLVGLWIFSRAVYRVGWKYWLACRPRADIHYAAT